MVVALTAGVGLTIAAYSLIHAVLVRPLPYSEPARLVQIWDPGSERTDTRRLSERVRESLEAGPSPFQGVASHDPIRGRDLLRGPGSAPVELLGAQVSVNLFNVLGVQASTGRTLQSADRRLTDVSPIVVSQRLVRSGLVSGRLGGLVSFENARYRLVGTMPDSFWFPDRQTDYWVPVLDVPEQPGTGTSTVLSPTIARLAPEVTVASARAQANTLLSRPGDPPGRLRVNVESHQLLATRPLRPSLVVLQAASGLVLLLVCLNVGWLFAARGRRLGRTLATIRALGATTRQILVTHLASAVCVAAVAAPCAVLVAWGLLRVGLGLDSAIFTRTAEPAITWHVMTVAFLSTMLAIVASCLPGAVAVARSPGSLHGHARLATRGRRFERSIMVVQVSLVFALGAQAILVALVLQSLVRTNVGLTKTDYLVVSIEPRGAVTIDPPVQLARYSLLLEELGRRDIRAAAASMFPFVGTDFRSTFEPRVSREQQRAMVRVRVVTPSYFQVIGMVATRGRLLTADDAGAHRMAVTDAFATAVLPGGDVVGRCVGLNFEWTVLGVAPPLRQFAVNEEVQPEAYILYDDFVELRPDMAARVMRGAYILAETTSGTTATLAIIRAVVGKQMPEFTIRSASPVDDIIRRGVGTNRLVAAGSVVFASVSLLLAALGLYAMVSHGLALRGREIGVRMALGATAGRIALESARPVGIVYAVGLCAGTALLLVAMSAIRSVMVPPPGVAYPSVGAVTFTSGAILFVVFAAACYRPIRSATRVDAAVSLRSD